VAGSVSGTLRSCAACINCIVVPRRRRYDFPDDVGRVALLVSSPLRLRSRYAAAPCRVDTPRPVSDARIVEVGGRSEVRLVAHLLEVPSSNSTPSIHASPNAPLLLEPLCVAHPVLDEALIACGAAADGC
jgi:hypothetical protein